MRIQQEEFAFNAKYAAKAESLHLKSSLEQFEATKELYKDQLMTALLENMRIVAQNQHRYSILEIKYKRSEAGLEISDKDIIFISMKLEKLRDRT